MWLCEAYNISFINFANASPNEGEVGVKLKFFLLILRNFVFKKGIIFLIRLELQFIKLGLDKMQRKLEQLSVSTTDITYNLGL